MDQMNDQWLGMTKVTQETGDRLADQRGWPTLDAMVEELGVAEDEIVGKYVEDWDAVDMSDQTVTGTLGAIEAVNWIYDPTVGGYRVFEAVLPAVVVPKETVNCRAYVSWKTFENTLL